MREKVKKARREEARECLWENLTKDHSPTYRPPTETRNMTDMTGWLVVFTCQPFFETYSRNISNFVPQTESQHLETYFAIEMSLNKA